MKTTIFTLFICLLSFSFAVGQTLVSGTIIGNTTWTKANSPYELTGTVTVNPGITLTVEPGVIVRFNSYTYSITVLGTIVAEGLAADSIIFSGSTSPGRIILSSGGSNSRFRYCQFNNLGAFNNPAILANTSVPVINRNTFDNCEVGVTVDNGSTVIIDSNLITGSKDYGIRHINGLAYVRNNTIASSFFSGIYLEDMAVVSNNSLNNNGSGIGRSGIHIAKAVYPYISNNTFIGNFWDILTHPAVANDTMFDNNNLSVIHIEGKTIGQSTTWHKPVSPENWTYSLAGTVVVSAADTLTVQAGVEVTFLNYTYDLQIDGTFISEGSPTDTIRYQGSPLGGEIVIRNGSAASKISYSRFDGLGAFNNPAITISSSDVQVRHNYFENCEVGITFTNGASPTVDSSVFLNSRDWALHVLSGNPVIRNSLLKHGNIGGVWVKDSTSIYNNSIVDNGSTTNSSSAGILIEEVVYPYINNNVFSNIGADILTHPAVMNDTLFDNNGLSVIHIDDKPIGQSAIWHEPVLPENWFYKTTGDITVYTGDSLIIEPGVEIQFQNYTHDILVNGNIFANGTPTDTIIFRGSPLGGRIQLRTNSLESSFDYCRFSGLGAFNVAGLEIQGAQGSKVTRTSFVQCEVGIVISSDGFVDVDSSEFFSSADFGMSVQKGSAIIHNSVFDDNRFAGLQLQDTAYVENNIFSNHTFGNTYAALLIDNPIYPFVNNNTFSGNNWDVLVHPEILEDTIFNNNGLNRVHVLGQPLTKSTTWKSPKFPENWEYVITGNITQSAATNLEVEAGTRIKFSSYTNQLIINGNINSNGNASDSVLFTSSTIGGRILLNSSGGFSQFNHTKIQKLGAFNLPAIDVNNDSTFFSNVTFDQCEIGFRMGNSTRVIADSCLFEGSLDYGIFVNSGTLNVHQSCINGNNFGVFSSGTATVNAVNNWWGDVTGPLYTGNPGGLGDEISNGISYSPWLTFSPCVIDPEPLLTSFFPLDNSLNVPIGNTLHATFDQHIQKGLSGRIKILRQADSSVVYDQDVTHSSVSINLDTLFIANSLLPVNTPLFIIIDSNAIQNLNSTAFRGISEDSTWNFTTEDDFDNDGFTPSQGDCNDMDSLEFPGQKWFADLDLDGYGDANSFIIQCARPPGYILDSLDCDDTDSLQFPGQIWYADLDNDGYGDPNNFLIQCLQPPGYLLDTSDCDDLDSLQFPGQKWFLDADNDSFGDVTNFLIQCLRPPGYVLDSTDCNDNDSLEFPGQKWFADLDTDGFGNVQNFLIQCQRPPGYLLDSLDCDDTDSLEFPGQKWFADLDLDGFGDSLNFQIQCERPAGYILENTDCDDLDSTSYPGAAEILDNKDNDCDGEIDEDLNPGINELGFGGPWLWPNPGNGKIIISPPDGLATYTIKIYTLNGGLLSEHRAENSSQNMVLDLSAFNSGVYLIVFNSGEVTLRERLVIQ